MYESFLKLEIDNYDDASPGIIIEEIMEEIRLRTFLYWLKSSIGTVGKI